MTPMQPVIANIGLITPVGLSATETADAVAGGIAGFANSGIILGGRLEITSAWIPNEGLATPDPDFRSSHRLNELGERLVRLGVPPLQRIMQGFPKGWPAPSLHVALPFDSFGKADAQKLLSLMAEGAGIPWNAALSSTIVQGRAGGLAAVHAAMDAVTSGRAPCAIAGAVDSYCDFTRLARLFGQGRIKTELIGDAFIPGEASGWILVMSPESARADGIVPMGQLGPVAFGHENGHLGSTEPYKGDALAQVFSQVLPGLATPVTDIWSSMTGESHWAKEWSVALIRNKDRIAEQVRLHHPADCMGDVGTATGIILVGLALTTRRHEGSVAPVVVYASADDGPRAAMTIIPLPVGA